MAYDEALAERVRDLLAGQPKVVEQRMFGGLAFILAGHMAVGVSGQGGLMLCCDPAEAKVLLGDPNASPMEMRGRELSGWLRVADAGVVEDDDLARWVTVGVNRARNRPPKSPRAR